MRIEEPTNELATVPLCEFTAEDPEEMYDQMHAVIPLGSRFVSAHLIGETVFVIYAGNKSKPIKKKRWWQL